MISKKKIRYLTLKPIILCFFVAHKIKIIIMKDKKAIIEAVWENRDLLKDLKNQEVIKSVLDLLDQGKIRVCDFIDNQWIVNNWVKKAVILYFPIAILLHRNN